MLQKIKSNSGFTIVELLIVIVVIAILAAISIVAYNGIQSRGKASSAQALANQITKKAEAWNTVQTGYPTYCQLVTSMSSATGTGTGAGTAGCTAGSTAGPTEAKIDDTTELTHNTPANESAVLYRRCSATTAQVQWYDATVPGTKIIGLGGASTASLCTEA